MRAGKADVVLAVFATMALFLSILLLTFQVLLAPPLTRAFADRCVNDAASPATHEQLVDAACATLAYCTGDPDANIPYGTDESTSYTPEVMGHLDDVTGFFSGMRLAGLLSAIALAALLLLLWWSCKRHGARGLMKRLLARIMLIAPCCVLGVIVVAGLAAVIDFNALFNLLHSFFFSSGSWLFPYDSLLICALPEEFWMSMGLFWLGEIVLVCIALIVVSIVLRVRLRRAAEQ